MRVKFTTTLDSEILKELKIQAVKEGTDVSKILEKLMVEYLEKQKGNSSPPSFSLKRARKLRGGSLLENYDKALIVKTSKKIFWSINIHYYFSYFYEFA